MTRTASRRLGLDHPRPTLTPDIRLGETIALRHRDLGALLPQRLLDSELPTPHFQPS
jgi:hypothetical protein